MIVEEQASTLKALLARFKSIALRIASRSPRVRSLIFGRVFRGNHWGDSESASGAGSNLAQTATLRAALPKVLAAYDVKSMLDIPCGDGNWIRTVELGLESYVGGDVVQALVERLSREARSHERFTVLDAASGRLPRADLIMCRDLLVHLDFRTILECVENFQRSGARWLLTTTFVHRTSNHDITTGGWRPLNLCAEPFSFPTPEHLLLENCTEGDGVYADKALGLWDLQALELR